MTRNARIALAAFVFGVLAGAPGAQAGVYADDLGKCLVESSSSQDKVELVRWMFAAISAHPAVKGVSAITEEGRQAASRTFAEIITRLLTEDCRDQASKAVRYEGASAFESSFGILGEMATQELFQHPAVAAVLTDLEKYLDAKKLEQLAKPAPEENPDER